MMAPKCSAFNGTRAVHFANNVDDFTGRLFESKVAVPSQYGCVMRG